MGAAATGGPTSRSTTRRWSGAGPTSSRDWVGVCKDHRDPNPRLHGWLSGWEDWRAEADEYVERGDYVIVLATYHGRGKGSGVEIHQEGAHVFKLRDGKVVRLEIFASRARAIEWVDARWRTRCRAMIDESTEFGARVARHLREEIVVWMTTVAPDGSPLPMPVWFHWDGGENVLMYSQRGARVRNIEANPHVTLNFAGDGDGGDIVVLSGTRGDRR